MDKLSVSAFCSVLKTEVPDIGEDTIEILRKQRMSGKRAMMLTTVHLNNMGIAYGDAMDICQVLEKSRTGTINLGSHQLLEDLNTTKQSPNETLHQSPMEHVGEKDIEMNAEYEDIRPYFSTEEFEEMGEMEKKCYASKKRIYELSIERGFTMTPPTLMTKHQKEKHIARPSCSSNKKKSIQSATKNYATRSKMQTKNSEQEKPTSGSSVEENEIAGKLMTVTEQPAASKQSGVPAATKASTLMNTDQAASSNEKMASKEVEEAKYAASLPLFDIDELLLQGKDKLQCVRELLKESGIIFGDQRKLMVRTLVNLMVKQVGSLKLVTTEMREGLAASIVAQYPKFKDNSLSEKWSWFRLYDRKKNDGFIAHVVTNMYRKLDPQDRPRRKRKDCGVPEVEDTVESPNSGVDEVEDVEWLTLVMPTAGEKSRILSAMAGSYKARRNYINTQQPSITEVLLKYPHLLAYNGELLEEEFSRLHPGKSRVFLRTFPSLIQRLQSKSSDCALFCIVEELDCGEDRDIINGCFAIAKRLPRPNLQRYASRNQEESLMPKMESLMKIITRGTNVQNLIENKRKKGVSVQPYLLAVAPEKKIVRLLLVVDSKSMQLPSASALKGLDVLFKVYQIFNVEYPLGWKKFWALVEGGVVKTNPKVLSNSAAELLRQLSENSA